MTTIRDFDQRKIVLRSLREGIDICARASTQAPRPGADDGRVLASLAKLELELGRGRRSAAREARRARGQHMVVQDPFARRFDCTRDTVVRIVRGPDVPVQAAMSRAAVVAPMTARDLGTDALNLERNVRIATWPCRGGGADMSAAIGGS
jgi:hypothetical protein